MTAGWFLSPPQRRGYLLYLANRDLSSEPLWLDRLNRYFAAWGLEPVTLAPGPRPKYFRLQPAEGPAPIVDSELISVIMTTYNAAWCLDLAIGSLVDQTWTNWELVVIDDASTDETWSRLQDWAARDPRIRPFRSPGNGGPFLLRNWALALCRGTWVTTADADDWNHPARLAHQRAYQVARPRELGHIGSWIRVTDQGRFWAYSGARPDQDGYSNRSPVTAFFHRERLISEFGGWDTARYGADVELPARIATKDPGALSNFDLPLVLGLSHPQSLSAEQRFMGPQVKKTLSYHTQYRQAFEAWHQSQGFNPKIDPFPVTRPFAIPAPMETNEAVLLALRSLQPS